MQDFLNAPWGKDLSRSQYVAKVKKKDAAV